MNNYDNLRIAKESAQEYVADGLDYKHYEGEAIIDGVSYWVEGTEGWDDDSTIDDIKRNNGDDLDELTDAEVEAIRSIILKEL